MKFLKFIDDGDDAAMYPADRLLAVTCATGGTVLCKFESGIGSFGTDGSAHDLVTLTVTEDTEDKVMNAIAKACGHSRKSVITVCDDVNKEFLISDILSCAITLDT